MDKQSFTDQVMAREQTLYRVARSLLASNEDCKDALQEAVLKAWASRNTLRDETLFATWLTRILINVCKAMHRRHGKYLLLSEVKAEAVIDAPDPYVREALDRLPQKQRLPVVLHYMEGYSLKEVASMLHLPESTLRGRLYQARQALKLALDDEKEDQ
jgi:RNA polymerase sigma-70 factor (ECF subfamily)